MPVAIITAWQRELVYGTTISSLCSLSLSPPLVAVALDRHSNTLGILRATRRFGVNVLTADQARLARACAAKGTRKLDAMEWKLVGDLPRIDGVSVWLACSLWSWYPGGDHEIVVGLITQSQADEGSTPLVIHRRRLTQVADHAGAHDAAATPTSQSPD